MCHLRNIAMRDYQESVITGQTDGRTDRCRTKWSLCAAMLCRRHKNIKVHTSFLLGCQNFYAPGLKGPPGACCNRIVRLSVRPSVCLSVRNSVPLSNKVQYLKFGWWYSNQTWTVSPSMDCSHFTDIPCPWGWGGVKNVGLGDFCHILTLLLPGASVFLKHISCFIKFCWEMP